MLYMTEAGTSSMLECVPFIMNCIESGHVVCQNRLQVSTLLMKLDAGCISFSAICN